MKVKPSDCKEGKPFLSSPAGQTKEIAARASSACPPAACWGDLAPTALYHVC